VGLERLGILEVLEGLEALENLAHLGSPGSLEDRYFLVDLEILESLLILDILESQLHLEVLESPVFLQNPANLGNPVDLGHLDHLAIQSCLQRPEDRLNILEFPVVPVVLGSPEHQENHSHPKSL